MRLTEKVAQLGFHVCPDGVHTPDGVLVVFEPRQQGHDTAGIAAFVRVILVVYDALNEPHWMLVEPADCYVTCGCEKAGGGGCTKLDDCHEFKKCANGTDNCEYGYNNCDLAVAVALP